MKIAISNARDPDTGRFPCHRHVPLVLVLLSGICFGASVWGFGAALDGYSQLAYPVSVLGARGIPHAAAFNVIGFVVPGVLMGVVAATSCRRLSSAGAMARIGGWIALFSTLAFVALGVFPLQLEDSEAASGRLHIACWSLWWLTTATGGVLLAVGSRNSALARRVGGAALAVLVPWCSVLAPVEWGFALQQRIAFAAWFGWWLLAATRVSRNAASTPGSSPPARG